MNRSDDRRKLRNLRKQGEIDAARAKASKIGAQKSSVTERFVSENTSQRPLVSRLANVLLVVVRMQVNSLVWPFEWLDRKLRSAKPKKTTAAGRRHDA